jgi:glycerol-3-phosphate acyltransferase PlsY
MLFALAATALSYLAGSFPTSYLAGRAFKGIDLRRHGSGNLGATNVYRLLGAGPAALVALVDIAKGFVPVWFLPQLLGEGPAQTAGAATVAAAFGGTADGALLSAACGMAAILGHVFPVWLRFKGGKGVATAVGVFLALSPLATLSALAIWAVTVALTRIVAVASLALGLCLVPLVYAEQRGSEELPFLVGFAALAALFVFWTHRKNLRRLLRGEERRISRAPRSSR